LLIHRNAWRAHGAIVLRWNADRFKMSAARPVGYERRLARGPSEAKRHAAFGRSGGGRLAGNPLVPAKAETQVRGSSGYRLSLRLPACARANWMSLLNTA
jgi:hypothetical protein